MSHVTTAAASRHKGYCAPHAFGIAVHVNPKPMVRNVLAGISESQHHTSKLHHTRRCQRPKSVGGFVGLSSGGWICQECNLKDFKRNTMHERIGRFEGSKKFRKQWQLEAFTDKFGIG